MGCYRAMLQWPLLTSCAAMRGSSDSPSGPSWSLLGEHVGHSQGDIFVVPKGGVNGCNQNLVSCSRSGVYVNLLQSIILFYCRSLGR